MCTFLQEQLKALDIPCLDTRVLLNIPPLLRYNLLRKQLMAFHMLSHGILVQIRIILLINKPLQGLVKVIDTSNPDIQDQIDIIR